MQTMIGGKTLTEIWEMPRTESLKHMRTYVNPKWGMDICEGEKRYKVYVEWETKETFNDTITLDAGSEEEAIDKAVEELKLGLDDEVIESYVVDSWIMNEEQ